MIEIKEITDEADVPSLVEAINKASWSEKSEIEIGDYTIESIKEYIVQASHIFCVAFFEDKFSGMASAFVMKKPNGNAWLYVDEVDVCENKQGQGIGTALMEFLFSQAQKNGCDEIWLGTETDNIPANALYKSLKPTETEGFVGYTFKM